MRVYGVDNEPGGGPRGSGSRPRRKIRVKCLECRRRDAISALPSPRRPDLFREFGEEVAGAKRALRRAVSRCPLFGGLHAASPEHPDRQRIGRRLFRHSRSDAAAAPRRKSQATRLDASQSEVMQYPARNKHVRIASVAMTLGRTCGFASASAGLRDEISTGGTERRRSCPRRMFVMRATPAFSTLEKCRRIERSTC